MAENKRPHGPSSVINNYHNNDKHNGNNNNDNWKDNNGNLSDTTQNKNQNKPNKGEKRIDFANLAPRKSKVSKSSPMRMAMRPRNVLDEADGDDMRQHVVDTQRMQLISPPPEETLRRNPRSSGQFTPSLLADPSPKPARVSSSSTTKRKRTQQASISTTTNATMDTIPAMDHGEMQLQHQQAAEATPNPKPRKQGRHSRQKSMDSPTKSSYGQSFNNDKNATPSRPKRVVVHSPHVENPDADWIPSTPMLSLSSAPSRRAVLGARGSRRSATPIPPYEPPKDVFTPPREVYMSPVVKSSSRTSKRKSPTTSKKSRPTNLRVVTTQVKQEIPDDIDLSAPMPPPSPSDDPLLLSGPPEPPIESSPLRHVVPRRSVSIQAEAELLPPSSPEAPLDSDEAHAVNAFDFGATGDLSTDVEGDSVMQFDPRDADVVPVRLFDLDDFPAGSGGWSDSDNEMEQLSARKGSEEVIEEGEGEYTGRWTMMKVRTKQDPPSSATRGRMEEWGRPISPFPYPKVKKLDLVNEEEDEEMTVDQVENAREEEEVRLMSVEPEESLQPPSISDQDEEEEEEREVRQMSVEFDDEEDHGLDTANEEIDPSEFSPPSKKSTLQPVQLDEDQGVDASNQEINLSQFSHPFAANPSQPIREPSPASTVVDSSASNAFAFSSSELPEAGPSSHTTDGNSSTLRVAIPEDHISNVLITSHNSVDDDDDDDSSLGDASFVKITSADPRAAARAVAILKQHDYDCYTKLAMKRKQSEVAKHRRASHFTIGDLAKESRRRDVISSGVSKLSGKRRSTLGMGVIGDRVFIPGSPIMTIPELLKVAEDEVGCRIDKNPLPVWNTRAALETVGQRDPFKTPMVVRRTKMSTPIAEVRNLHSSTNENVGRPWTKEEWKNLDACFTDQRLEIGVALEGAEEDTLAPVDMVSVEDVVDRFVAYVGGPDVIHSYGEVWSRENLIERTRALQRKQRAGNVARPTTPRSSSVPCSPFTPTEVVQALGGDHRVPRMEVPDFTPLGRRAGPPPRRSHAILPVPISHDSPSPDLHPVPKDRGSSKRIPSTLLAPRYSHLLEEAVSISKEGNQRQKTQNTVQVEEDALNLEYANSSFGPQSFDQSIISVNLEPIKTPAPRISHDPLDSTLGKRVKGFLFSYLPRLSSKPPPTSLPSRKPVSNPQPGLPLPPLDVLEKPRGPVTTPARPPLPRTKAPKELVQLNPAPPIQPHVLPRAVKPQRLVELHHLPPPQEQPVVSKSFSRPRRSSGSSVKDLVKGFEEMQRKEEKSNTIKRVKSIGDLNRKNIPDTRPRWRL